MADSVQIKLTGHLDVAAAFKAFREDLPKNPMRKAVKAAADMLTREVQTVTPVESGTLLENTRTSISVSKRGGTRGRVVINKVAFYWYFLVHGWHSRSGIFHQKDYVSPTVTAHEREAAQIVIDECEKQVRKLQEKLYGGGMSV